MHRGASLGYRPKFTFRYRRIRHIAKRSSKPRSIALSTKVCPQKLIARRNFSGKAERLQMRVRKAVEVDIPKLLPLMRELAVFEKYDHAFAITEEVLREKGFRRSPPDFHCLVAEEHGELIGILVYYFVPFTYRAKPNLIIKELYVADEHRSQGVGELL